MSWRVQDAFVEGVRNYATGGMKTWVLRAATVLLAATITWAELAFAADLVGFNDRFLEAGGAVVRAMDYGAGLSAKACDDLREEPWVDRSGGVRWLEQELMHSDPRFGFTAVGFTGDALGVLTGGDVAQGAVGKGIVLGDAAAGEIGVQPGMAVNVGGDIVEVGSVVDTSARSPELGRFLMWPMVSSGSVNQCWVEVIPGTQDEAVSYLSASFSDVEELVVDRVAKTDEFSRDPVSEIASRSLAQAWLLMAGVLGLLFWVSLFLRRSHIGLYRALGAGSPELFTIGFAEALAVLVPAAVSGVLWTMAAFVAHRHGQFELDGAMLAVRNVSSGVLLALVCVPAGWLVLGWGHLLNQLKDR